MEISKSTVGIDESQELDIKDWSSTNEYYDFKEADNKDIFLLAASKGYELFQKDTQISIKGGGFFRTSYLKKEDFALLNALFIEKVGMVEGILKKEDVLRFAEVSAYRGFQIIKMEIDESTPENFERKLLIEMDKKYKSIFEGK